MNEPAKSTALVTQVFDKPVVSTKTATTEIRLETSRILQLAAHPSETEKPRKLFEGWYELSKPGYFPLRPCYLQVYTYNAETLALVSNKLQIVSHQEAAEQIAADLSLSPAHFLYLSRVQAGKSLCRDLITAYTFDWEWISRTGKWMAVRATYCYRVVDSIESAVQRLFQIDREAHGTAVVDGDQNQDE